MRRRLSVTLLALLAVLVATNVAGANPPPEFVIVDELPDGGIVSDWRINGQPLRCAYGTDYNDRAIEPLACLDLTVTPTPTAVPNPVPQFTPLRTAVPTAEPQPTFMVLDTARPFPSFNG